MEISESITVPIMEYTRVNSEQARVVPIQDVNTSKLNSSTAKRVIATTLAGTGSSDVSLPLSSGGDVRNVTLAKTGLESDSSQVQVDNSSSVQASESNAVSTDLTPAEEDQIRRLKARDLEVRQHEQSHLAAAGSYASGGIQYEYQTGPDGKQYAIGGHVNLDTSKESSPEATIAKARQIQRAALAPADPSPQDVKVAAQANQMILEAQRELTAESSDSSGSQETGNVSDKSAEDVSFNTQKVESPTVRDLGLIEN